MKKRATLSAEFQRLRTMIGGLKSSLKHQHSEELFRPLENEYRTIFETTGTAMVIIQESMVLSLVNAEFEKISGYSRKDVEGKKKITDFVLPADAQRLRKYHHLRRVNPELAPHSYEFSFLDKNGRNKDIFITVGLIPGTGESVASLLDITERRQAETRLKAAEERYRTIFDNSAVAITVTDARERIVSWNRFAEHLLGMNRDDFYLKKVNSLYPKEEWRKIRSYNIRRKGMQHHLETRIMKKSKEVIDVDISISVLKDGEGNITGSIGIIRDITERRQAEKKIQESKRNLEQANRQLRAKELALRKALAAMKTANDALRAAQDQLLQSGKMAAIGQLSVGIAHEIKNPLTIILQGMEALERVVVSSGGKGNEYLQMVKNAALRANKVIIELLNFSRSAELKEKPLDIKEAVEKSVSLIRTQTKLENIMITCEYAHGQNLISADSILLEEVFFNLLINAVEAMDAGGEVKIKTYLAQDPHRSGESRLVVEVIDTGKGIPQRNLPRIFEPFFTTKEQGKGTGLGLSMVYLILKRHNGSISVKSKEGQGTQFTIFLPLLTGTDKPTGGGIDG
jgi:PAS domain S-box-containing protein